MKVIVQPIRRLSLNWYMQWHAKLLHSLFDISCVINLAGQVPCEMQYARCFAEIWTTRMPHLQSIKTYYHGCIPLESKTIIPSSYEDQKIDAYLGFLCITLISDSLMGVFEEHGK